MAVIRANRESIDDRFSVLGFTVRSELPLFEIAIATDPELLRPELRTRRTPGNFHTSRLLRAAPSQRGEAVYLVPPDVVSRFVGQPRLYFGLATYRESDRSTPVSMRMPDRGTMYVSLSGLTERGLRRTVRSRAPMANGSAGYGGNGVELGWGGDAATATPPPSRDEDRSSGPRAKMNSGAGEPATYSDGYSEDLWKQAPAAAAPAPAEAPAVSTTPAAATPATAQGLAVRNAAVRRPMATSRSLLISSDYHPSNLWDALRAQAGFFLDSAMWYLGVGDTRVMPHSAICQIRVPDGTVEGGLHGSGFFIGPRLIMTAAHVVDGQSELIVVPGKNGGGTASATEPFGRFNVTQFRKHDSYGSNGSDYDMALICVPAANAVGSGQYFDLVEELNQSRPEGVVVSGYAARWYANDVIEHFVNDTIDPNRQHMMGGYIRELPTDETFSYNIQTLGGTSGSPVYWIEDTGAGPQAHMVGVHVAAHDATTNLGCRITANKLAWIRRIAAEWSQTLTFSMGRYARSLSAVDEDSAYDIGGPIPDQSGPAQSGPAQRAPDAAASTAQSWYGARGLTLTAPEYPMASRFEAAATGNFRAVGGTRTIDRIVIHITDGGANINGTISWFKNPAAKVSSHYVIGQDGEIVQMVAHNNVAWHAGSANSTSIGIEHVANTRGLHPTPAQMCASAALVTWLCDQYGITPDRAHILGHAEADARTTHRACPNAVWDWVYYMDMITTRTCYVPDTMMPRTQSLGYRAHQRRNGYAAAQEIITPFYDPADPMSALTCQNDAFSQAREEWFVGVENTRFFPHSAICLLEMTNSSGGKSYGTGFYIGRNRILTCAHNLSGKASAVVMPGKNGAGNEPFGRFTVASSSWRVSPRYLNSSSSDDDLAVIDNVPIDAPNGQWFEFLNATPSDRLPLVVCGYSRKSDVVPELTALMDGEKQHLHGGYAQRMTTPETIDYPILTLHRASGSPVYTLRDDGSGLRALVCAVHVSGAPASDGLNRGCFITPAKIDWIEGRTTSFSLGMPVRRQAVRTLGDAFSVHWTDVPMTYQTSPMSCWAAAASMVVGWRDQQSIPDSAIADKVPVFDAFNSGLYGHERGFVADAWNLMAEAPASYTIEAWRDMLANNGPLYIDQVASVAGGGHVRVLVGMTSGGAADGSDTTMFMHDPARGPIRLSFADFLALYEGRTANTGGYLQFQIMHAGGVTAGRRPASASAFALGTAGARSLAYGRALANDGPSDQPVHLIAQPNKDACWAAAMAMLLAHRRQQSRTPESIVNEVGGSLASSYGWDLIEAVKTRYGFEVIPQPSNASIYHTPRQWAEWLNTYGPLWVVIVGAPHAVVVAGIRGNLDDANASQVKILNPWDTRVAFDSDPIDFHPANYGYEDWLPFADFAADFGNMAEPDYGNWRILHLPVSAASSQSLSMRGNGGLRLAPPPPPLRALNVDGSGERRELIEPSRVLGASMSRVIGEAGGSRWSLDQLEGLKSPATLSPSVSSAAAADVRIDINDWPAIEGAPTPLPLKIEFRVNNGSLGDVRISAGTPANLAYGVEAIAKIEDCADADGVARLRVRIDYRFRGLAQGNPDARIELNLRGDGRHERENGWRDASVERPDLLNTAA